MRYRRQTCPTDERWCWFEGINAKELAAAQHTEDETSHAPTHIAPTESLLLGADGKPKPARRSLRYFVSWAHKDKKIAAEFLDYLYAHLANSALCKFDLWLDIDALQLGELWERRINAGLNVCDFGLLLVSPNFLSSPYIQKVELPAFVSADGVVDGRRRAHPVVIEKIPFDGSYNLRGLQHTQLFLDMDGKSFAERSTGAPRKKFVDQFFARLNRALATQLN